VGDYRGVTENDIMINWEIGAGGKKEDSLLGMPTEEL
jgi:hypothetical protein